MSATAQEKRARFRSILAGDVCVRPASVFDPLSARIAEELGFETMMFAGSTAALAVLGNPDLNLITLTEFADQARRVARAANPPMLVDADHGYGNALNVMRTVEELEHAGVAALTIEDTVLPTPFGTVGQDHLISIEEGVGKIAAARAGRRDAALVIAARTSALRITSLDDTVRRLKAYAAAGADALYLTGVRTDEELQAVCAATSLPLMVGNVPEPLDDMVRFAKLGVRLGLQGHRTVAVAYTALRAAMQRLRGGELPQNLGDKSLEALMRQLSKAEDYAELERRFLSASPASTKHP